MGVLKKFWIFLSPKEWEPWIDMVTVIVLFMHEVCTVRKSAVMNGILFIYRAIFMLSSRGGRFIGQKHWIYWAKYKFYVQKQLLLSVCLSHRNSVHLSVCLSNTRVDQSKMIQDRITKFSDSSFRNHKAFP